MKELQSNVSWDELFMRHVYLIATKSKDPRTKIGAVLVKNGIIISEGYNGFARGVKDYEERYLNRELKYKFVVHGEANAVLNAVRHGINTSGSACYTQGLPCHDCMKTLIQAGVVEVIIHTLWPSIKGGPWEESHSISKQMCTEAGIIVRAMGQPLGVTAYSNGEATRV